MACLLWRARQHHRPCRLHASAVCIRCAPQGKVSVASLDLADLSSIKALAGSPPVGSLAKLDLLVLNAGVMACPLGRTKDGFEMQARMVGQAGRVLVRWGLPAWGPANYQPP